MAHKTSAATFHQQPLVLAAGSATTPGEEHIFLSRIYSLLEQHLPDPTISVNWLAIQLAINRKTLYRRVKRFTQSTPTDLICQYRLHRAIGLLRIGYTVSNTACLIGFKNSSHFSAVFKKLYRKTPTEFIASQLKKA